MSGISTYAANLLADLTFRGQTFTPPTQIYMSLYESEPGPDDSGTELNGAGYARQPITFGPPSGRQSLNTSGVVFGSASSNWNTANFAGLHDAVTGGNLLSWSDVNPAQTVPSGDSLTFPAGSAPLDMLGGVSDYWAGVCINYLYRNTTVAPPGSIYLGLYSTSPDVDNSGNEISGNSYARQAITFNAAAGGLCENAAVVTFPTASPAAQGTNAHYGILDTGGTSGGNLLTYGPWGLATTIDVNRFFEVPATRLKIRVV